MDRDRNGVGRIYLTVMFLVPKISLLAWTSQMDNPLDGRACVRGEYARRVRVEGERSEKHPYWNGILGRNQDGTMIVQYWNRVSNKRAKKKPHNSENWRLMSSQAGIWFSTRYLTSMFRLSFTVTWNYSRFQIHWWSQRSEDSHLVFLISSWLRSKGVLLVDSSCNREYGIQTFVGLTAF